MGNARPNPQLVRRKARALRPTGWRARVPGLAVVMLGTVAALVLADSARAQRAVEPRITVASRIVAEPASQFSLAIQVGPPDALPSNSFVRLRGLPPSVSLTEGHAIAPGSWAIPLFGLVSLRANVPAGVSGKTEVVVSLVTVDGTLLAEARTSLTIGQPTPLPPADKESGKPPQKQLGFMAAPPLPVPAGKPDRNSPAGPRGAGLSAEQKARSEDFLAQGETFLSQGKVEVARQYFERAADIGLAAAALRLAATYDPGELDRLQTLGVVPDPALARKWYERASKLGAPEAEERLARLGGR